MSRKKPTPRLTAQSTADLEASRRDDALVRSLLDGDPKAIERLIDLYDSVIRFTIFHGFKTHCRRDPTFLDARASEVWTGFVDSLNRTRRGPQGPLKGYLAQIARNKCNDYVRHADHDLPLDAVHTVRTVQIGTTEGPLEAMVVFEQVEQVRECIKKLGENDRKIMQELELISQSRWSQAADRLSMPESTLRSCWQRICDQLRRCVEKNTPEK